MTPIENILKPKSNEEVSAEIRGMSAFEFVEMFYSIKIGKLRVGFKKRITHFFISKGGASKLFSRAYYIIWFSWLVLNFGTWWIFPASDLFPEGPFDVFIDVLWFAMMSFLFMWVPAFIIMMRFTKWRNKRNAIRHRELINDFMGQAANQLAQEIDRDILRQIFEVQRWPPENYNLENNETSEE